MVAGQSVRARHSQLVRWRVTPDSPQYQADGNPSPSRLFVDSYLAASEAVIETKDVASAKQLVIELAEAGFHGVEREWAYDRKGPTSEIKRPHPTPTTSTRTASPPPIPDNPQQRAKPPFFDLSSASPMPDLLAA